MLFSVYRNGGNRTRREQKHQQTAEQQKTSTESGGQYSIRKDIVDVNGKEYETVVELDKIASKRVLSEPKRLLNYIKANFVGLKIPVEDNNGNTEIIEFAAENETVTKNGNNHPVLRELAHTKGETRRKVIINAKEVIEESAYDPDYSSTDNDHGWLDKNGWESRKTYVLQDGVIYEAYLKIAKSADGRNILYAVNLDINNGIAVDQGATQKRAAILSAMPSSVKISQNKENVKQNLSPDSEGATGRGEEQYSLSDTVSDDGKRLTFKSSELKYSYENGELVIENITTPLQERNQGSATKLMDAVIQKAYDEGVEKITGYIYPQDNDTSLERLRDFYEKFGAEIDSYDFFEITPYETGEEYGAAGLNKSAFSMPESKQYSLTQSDRKFADYDKPITLDDNKILRDIGKKSINEFSPEEIEIAQKWAYKFYQQLGTKSPFFRRWFGDWRAYDKNTKRKYLSLNTLAINASDVSRETAKNIDTNWSIEVSRNGIDETSNKRGKWSNEYHSLANIQEMLVNAVLLDTVVVNEPSKRLGNNSAFLHHMYCPVSIDGEKGIAKLYVTEEVGNINKFYLVKIEMVPTDSTVLGIEASAPNSSVDTELSVADIFRFVKENNDKFESDSDNPIPFTPKPVNEVLIENGKPKVFYHGTNENFTEFSPDEFAPREGSFFFAENREDAAAYGNNIFEVYLRGENLADYDNQPLEFYRLRDKRKQVEYLKERGYDGWYADMDSEGWGEVSVFSPSQIKSAKDGGNIGTFSEAENDIQYSLPQEVEEEYMSAVESGQESEMQRLVDIAAEMAMPDSVVRIRI